MSLRSAERLTEDRGMPIYEYECRGCGEHHEFIQKFSDSPKRKCPSCGKLRLKKLISAAAFHLKGDGWYVTDFRDKGKSKDKDTSKGKPDSTESSGDSKSDSKSSESKSADSKSTDSKSTDSKGGGESKISTGTSDSPRAA